MFAKPSGKQTVGSSALKVIVTFLALLLVISAITCFAKEAVPAKEDFSAKDSVSKCQGMRVAVFQDKSLSIESTRTPEARALDLEPLINLLNKCGGEMAVGLIADESWERKQKMLGQPLLRLRVPAPPIAPGIPDLRNRNPLFKLAERKELGEAEEQYRTDYAIWIERTRSNTEDFKKRLYSVLGFPADSRNTDVLTALSRGDVFLEEKFNVPVSKVLVLVTDGEHDVDNGTEAAMDTDGEVIVVNGSGRLGILGPLNPLQFESIHAAVSYIVGSHLGE